MRSKRSSDSAAEGVVARFLDLYFYPNIRSDWKREEEREAQLLGVDVTLETDSGSIAVDEKAAVHYVNKELPTFAFEINYYNEQGDLVGGWFLDPKKVTEWYLLIWIKAKKEKDMGLEDILELEVMMLEREQLKQDVEKKGALKGLEGGASLMRSEGIKKRSIAGQKDMYFYLTETLAEKPLNLIIRKSHLSKMALLHALVDRTGISKVISKRDP